MSAPEIKIPQKWMAEAQTAYQNYVAEWEREEILRVTEDGGIIEAAQPWAEFFSDYLYAELENAAWTEE